MSCGALARPAALTSLQRAVRTAPLNKRQLSVRAASAMGLSPPFHLVSLDKKPVFDIYVKGSPEKGELGDCPFSSRLLLTMQEKDIPYNLMLLDEQKLPDWIKEVSEGNKKIPFMLELDAGKWFHDSDLIYPMLEERFTSKKLGKMEDLPKVGEKLMPDCLIGFLTAKPDEEAQKKEALVKELEGINSFLEKNGPLFGGNDVNGLDMSLAPKLKHTIIACKTIKGYEIPKSLSAIWTYMDKIAERKSWQNTYYTEKYVADGWRLKVKMLTEG